MDTRSFILGMALVLLAGAADSAEVKTKHVHCSFAGTFVSGVENHLDTNGDMRSASVHQGLVTCNIGRFLFQEEFEFLDPLPAPVTCPTGTTLKIIGIVSHLLNLIGAFSCASGPPVWASSRTLELKFQERCRH
jgi:hypothetical protein